MKNSIFILITIFIGYSLTAQENSTDSLSKQELKKIKKEEKEQKLQKQFETTFQMLSDKSFVCEIKNLKFSDNPVSVNSMLNFIIVDSSEVIIQITPVNGAGANGFGGTTSKGTLSKYKLIKNDKRKSCNLVIILNTPEIGYFEANYSISSNGSAYANCSYGFNSVFKFSFEGQIVKSSESKILKGQAM